MIDPNLAVQERMSTYVKRSEILRQIHSDRLFKVQRRNRQSTFATIAITAAVGFVGFSGTERLRNQIGGVWSISLDAVNMIYNILVLATILISIGLIVYRLPEREAQHQRAIQLLTEFINDTEDQLTLSRISSNALGQSDLLMVTQQYKGITASLPPSSDDEFLKSKEKYYAKRRQSHSLARPSEVRRRDMTNIEALEALLASSSTSRALLEAIGTTATRTKQQLFLVGGAVRNTVWDYLHAYGVPTELQDIDVVFVSNPQDPMTEAQVHEHLRDLLPNVPWSVKDLRFVTPEFGRGFYQSIEDALREFPETASAVAVEPKDEGPRIVAPFGVDDLMDGVLRPTSRGAAARVEERSAQKAWEQRWPNLRREMPALGDSD